MGCTRGRRNKNQLYQMATRIRPEIAAAPRVDAVGHSTNGTTAADNPIASVRERPGCHGVETTGIE
jgi:hypothetical protein